MIDTTDRLPIRELTERCDSCPQQAVMCASKVVWANLEDLELFFCMHHGIKHHLALEVDGWNFAYDVPAIERLVDPKPQVLV